MWSCAGSGAGCTEVGVVTIGGADGGGDLVVANVCAGVRRVDHPAVSKSDTDMGNRFRPYAEEDKVAGLQFGVCREVGSGVVLLLSDAGQDQTSFGVGVLDKSGAVEA